MNTPDLIAARAIYDNLPTRARVTDALIASARTSFPVGVPSAEFGTVFLTACALRALDLDNLFSGRCRGEGVQEVLLAALSRAADSAPADLDVLPFAPSFGMLGTVRLMARAMDGEIHVFAA